MTPGRGMPRPYMGMTNFFKGILFTRKYTLSLLYKTVTSDVNVKPYGLDKA